MTEKRSRYFIIAGLVLMVAGALDPLEGSVVILAGSALAAVGAVFGMRRRSRLPLIALVLIAIGVIAMFGLSAIGGVGGESGRSLWWLAICVPYPVGWIIGLVGAFVLLRQRESRPIL